MDTRLNIFTKIEQVEFLPISLCHSQFIEYHHYCLSLAQLNDLKIIIVQECRGLSWNLQTFYSGEEDKVIWALCQINNANGSHSTFSSWSCPRYDLIKEKEIQRNTLKYFWSFWFFINKQIKREKQKREKLFTQESSQQVKEEQGNLFGFSFYHYNNLN